MIESFKMSENRNKKSNKMFSKRSLNLLSLKQKKVIKYLIAFVGVFGLFCQTVYLVIQYWQSQTVVNIKVERNMYTTIPAITICYPQLISMEKTAEKYPHLKPLFDNYKNQLKNVSKRGDFKDNYKSEYSHDSELGKTFKDLYYNEFESVVTNTSPKVTDLFDLSIPFIIPKRSSHFNAKYSDLKSIDITVQGMRLFPNQTYRNFSIIDTVPIETIVFKVTSDMNKCFTFFSHLNESFKNYKIDIKRIDIEIFNSENWFPPTFYDESEIFFSMHSPNVIPHRMDVNNFLQIKTGYFYEMTYNWWKTILLPEYEPKCENYDKQHFKLRSDCINHCIYKELKKKCSHSLSPNIQEINKLSDCIFREPYLWRKDSFDDNGLKDIKLCSDSSGNSSSLSNQTNCVRDNINTMDSLCQITCKNECINRFYNYDVKDHEKYIFYGLWSRNTRIKIVHNQLPDQINEHKAEMTFVTFAGGFGGLLGMWLGLSALALLSFILRLL